LSRTHTIHQQGHGSRPTVSDPCPATLLPQVSRRQLLDRYAQHTQHCPECRSGLALVSRLLSASKAVVAAAFLGLCGLAGHFGVTRLAGGGLPTAATVAVAVVGVVAAWLGKVCAGLEQQFIFTDHSHADNH
jgi:pheophorbide a oxygenase